MKLSSLLKLYVYFILPHYKTSSQQNEATDFPLPHFQSNFRHDSRLSKNFIIVTYDTPSHLSSLSLLLHIFQSDHPFLYNIQLLLFLLPYEFR